MAIPDDGLWPLATGPDRTRWPAQAIERYLHLARIIMTRAATWPAPEVPFPPEALELTHQLYEVSSASPPRDIATQTGKRGSLMEARDGVRRRRSKQCAVGREKAAPVAHGSVETPAAGPPGGRPGPETGTAPRLRLAGSGAPRKVAGPRRDDAQVRRLFNDVFRKSRPEIEAALTKCFTSPETVLACVELLARLEGELP